MIGNLFIYAGGMWIVRANNNALWRILLQYF